MAGASSKPLYVVAPRVRVKAGSAVKDLLLGDVLTEDIDKESVAHLKDLGFVSESSPFDGVKSD